jgi:hypothetical protein
MGSTTRLGPRLAHGLLEDTRQGDMDSKLSRTDLVGFIRKLDSIIELGLFYCNQLGLDTCPYSLPYIKRCTVHTLVLTIIQTNPMQRPHVALE